MAQATMSSSQLAEIASCTSPIGALAVAMVRDQVAAVSIGRRDAAQAERAVAKVLASYGDRWDELEIPVRTGPSEKQLDVDDVVALLADYSAGRPVDLLRVSIVDRHLTPFQRRVVAACRRIPLGETRSYGELAKQAGRVGAARAVGQVMATNRVPLLVPCHRVVASSGKLGGFSAPQGIALKQRLLDLEQAMVVAPA